MNSEKVTSLKRGEKAAIESALVMVILSLMKGVVGIVSGSVALLADAIHSFSDIFASIAVWLGLRFAQKKPSKRFTYGFGRVETLALLAVSIIIIVSGIEILIESIERLRTIVIIKYPHLTIAVALISVLTSLLLSIYKIKIGKKVGSHALIGDGKHSRADAFSSILVVIGVISSYFGVPWVEAFAGIIISLVVLKLGIWMGKDALLILLDVCMKPELIQQVKEIAGRVSGVKLVHNIKIRRAGPFILGEMHMETDQTLTVDKAHEISQEVENKVKSKMKDMDSLIIHIEPEKKDRYKLVIPIQQDRGLDSIISSHFGNAQYFVFIDVEGKKTVDWQILKNPGSSLDKGKGIVAANFLIKNKVNVLITKEIGQGPFHFLRDSAIKIFHLPEDTSIIGIVKEFSDQRLESLRTPQEKHSHTD